LESAAFSVLREKKMRMLGTMAIGIGLILALICHLAMHILPICLLATFIVLGTKPGFTTANKPTTRRSSNPGNAWFRMRGGC
jgi:hypothetical protein